MYRDSSATPWRDQILKYMRYGKKIELRKKKEKKKKIKKEGKSCNIYS